MEMSAADVVISYRREDSGDAHRLREKLGLHFGASRIFIDVTGIRAGENFPAAISEAIESCKALVALVTRNWAADLVNDDDWVRRELREALERGRPILPVFLRGAELNAAELPPEIAPVGEIQGLSLSDNDYRDDVAQLIEALERFVGSPVPDEAYPEISQTGRVEGRAMWEALETPERTERMLLAAIAELGLRVTGRGDDELLLAGGDKLKARVLGVVSGPESRLPLKGRVRIRDRGSSVTIEVLLGEDLGGAGFSMVRGRYESHFNNEIAALRKATRPD
jgi:hypothetical protein